MYELNASCPNTSHGGMVFGTDPPQLWELTARCKAAAKRPLMVKLSPNVTDIGLMARVAYDGGADAVSLVNTFVSLAIDVETRSPRIANITGGLSGPAIKPIAVRMVHEVFKGGEDSCRRYGRNPEGRGRCGVHDGGRDGGAGGHCELRRSARCREHRQRIEALVRRARCGPCQLAHRFGVALARSQFPPHLCLRIRSDD